MKSKEITTKQSTMKTGTKRMIHLLSNVKKKTPLEVMREMSPESKDTNGEKDLETQKN